MSEAGTHVIGSTVPGHYGPAGTDLVLREATLAATWNVQGDPARGSLVTDVARLFDVALPLDPNTATCTAAVVAMWLGPRSWLLIAGAGGPANALVEFDAKRDALNMGGGALFDVSASRVAYTLRGSNAATVLARGCPLDFSARVFAPGHCAQSMFGHVNALIYRHAATPAFTVMVARSLAVDVWRGLCVAASADGYDVQAPAPFDAASVAE
ncbi:MAG: sarcosine oxidase subunit gamma family protein [Betaproteobacteria bacterium]